MQISDLISIVGILLAIIAFINENERLFIWNKFSKTNKILIIFFLVFIHYLLFFDWFLNNINFLKKFTISNFPSSNSWAYFVSLCGLIWIIYKIFIAGFPKENDGNVLDYYNFLLNKKDYALLFNLIKKYNSETLLDNTDKYKDYQKKLVNLIFSNKRFLESTTEYNFDFFNSIINNQNVQRELIENYIESQILNDNSYFNSVNISNEKIKQLSIILCKVDSVSYLINQSLKNNKINYNSLLTLIFEHYKIDNDKSVNQIIESWRNIVKVNNANALKLFTNMIVTEKIDTENLNEIVNKISISLSQIELQNDDNFFNEVFYSYLKILNKCFELNTNFSKDTIIKITKISNNKLPEKLYNFYFDRYDSKNENLNNLIKLIANE